jgi:hypothetical protein
VSLDGVSTMTPPRPLFMLLHGSEGVGKTTFALNSPSPIFCPAEDAWLPPGVPRFDVPHSYNDFGQQLGQLIKGSHDYQTFVIDTVDWLEPLIEAEACTRKGWDSIDQPFGKGQVAVMEEWVTILQGLEELRKTRGMNVILVAHSETKTFTDPMRGAYDRWQIKLTKKAAQKITEKVDIVAFATFLGQTQEEAQAFGRKVASASSARTLKLDSRLSYQAKNRFNLPAECDLNYKTFAQLLEAQLTGGTTPPPDAGAAPSSGGSDGAAPLVPGPDPFGPESPNHNPESDTAVSPGDSGPTSPPYEGYDPLKPESNIKLPNGKTLVGVVVAGNFGWEYKEDIDDDEGWSLSSLPDGAVVEADTSVPEGEGS